MNNLINVGFGNIVNAEKIIAIIMSDSAPAKRLMQTSRKDGTAIDATHGRKVQSCLVMEGGRVVLSALTPETLVERFKSKEK